MFMWVIAVKLLVWPVAGNDLPVFFGDQYPQELKTLSQIYLLCWYKVTHRRINKRRNNQPERYRHE